MDQTENQTNTQETLPECQPTDHGYSYVLNQQKDNGLLVLFICPKCGKIKKELI